MLRMVSAVIAAVGISALASIVPTAAQEEGGRTLNALVWPEPPSLVLGLSIHTGTQQVSTKIYEGLVVYDFDLTPLPWLARSWEISDDQLTYTFHLQEDVRWHDGEPFTADDVVFTISEFMPEVNAQARLLFRNLESATALDAHTVQFQLREPFPAFLFGFNTLTAPILPRHIYEGTDYRNNPMNATPIGTGPFRFVEWRNGEYVHLVRNEDYWQEGLPHIDEIFFRVIPDEGARAIAVESGDVHIARAGQIGYREILRLGEDPRFYLDLRGGEFNAPQLWLQFNLRRPPIDDRRFRQAVMHALDREFIRDFIWYSLGTISTGPIAPTIPYYDPDVRQYEYDLDRARELLDEMGLEPDSDGIRARLVMPPPASEIYQRTSEYVAQQLEQIGIDVRLDRVDHATWANRVAEFDFDLTINLLEQLGDPAIGPTTFYHTNGIERGNPFGNNGGYSNPGIDALLDSGSVETDPARRQEIYSEVQAILAEDVPVGWLLETLRPVLHVTELENVVTTSRGYFATWADLRFVE